MKKYIQNEDGWFCGHWNKSPLQIKYSSERPLKDSLPHSHSFAEYYFVLNGKLILQINKNNIEINPMEILMVEPREKHKIISKTPLKCSYIVIKEKSYPKNKN